MEEGPASIGRGAFRVPGAFFPGELAGWFGGPERILTV